MTNGTKTYYGNFLIVAFRLRDNSKQYFHFQLFC